MIILCFSKVAYPECRQKQHSPLADLGKKIYPVGVPVIALLRGDFAGVIISATLIQVFYATNRYLKPAIGKTRPCGCQGGFPSGHAIMMGSGASFLAYRYGWRFGVPAMIITLLLHIDRIETQGHTWGDVIFTLIIYHLLTGLFVTRRGKRWRDKWSFLRRLYLRKNQ